MSATYLPSAVLWLLRQVAIIGGTLTAPGIAWVLRRPPASVESALQQLERDGAVARCGYGFTRQGRKARAWKVVK